MHGTLIDSTIVCSSLTGLLALCDSLHTGLHIIVMQQAQEVFKDLNVKSVAQLNICRNQFSAKCAAKQIWCKQAVESMCRAVTSHTRYGMQLVALGALCLCLDEQEHV